MNPDLLDALMRHRRRNAGWTPTETIPAVPATVRKARRDWAGILIVLPVAAIGLALVVAAGAHFTQGGVRVVHQVRVLTRWRDRTVTVIPAPQVRLVAAQPQVRTVTAAPRLIPAQPGPVVTVTAAARPVPAVTVTVTVTASPAVGATP